MSTPAIPAVVPALVAPEDPEFAKLWPMELKADGVLETVVFPRSWSREDCAETCREEFDWVAHMDLENARPEDARAGWLREMSAQEAVDEHGMDADEIHQPTIWMECTANAPGAVPVWAFGN